MIDTANWKIAISLQANIFNMIIFWLTSQTEKLQANGRKDVTERWLPAAIVEPSNIISGEYLLSKCPMSFLQAQVEVQDYFW